MSRQQPGIWHEFIKRRRRENFRFAHDLFGNINKINPLKYYDEDTIPVSYTHLDVYKRQERDYYSKLCIEAASRRTFDKEYENLTNMIN